MSKEPMTLTQQWVLIDAIIADTEEIDTTPGDTPSRIVGRNADIRYKAQKLREIVLRDLMPYSVEHMEMLEDQIRQHINMDRTQWDRTALLSKLDDLQAAINTMREALP